MQLVLYLTLEIVGCVSQCSTTGITKAVVRSILSKDGAYRRTLAANQKVACVVVAVGFLLLSLWSFPICLVQ